MLSPRNTTRLPASVSASFAASGAVRAVLKTTESANRIMSFPVEVPVARCRLLASGRAGGGVQRRSQDHAVDQSEARNGFAPLQGPAREFLSRVVHRHERVPAQAAPGGQILGAAGSVAVTRTMSPARRLLIRERKAI